MTAPVQANLGHFLMRDIHPWEGPGLFAMTGDDHVTRYMGFATHRSVDDATKLIAAYRNSPSRWQAVTLDGDPTDMLGIIGLEVQGHQATMTIMFRRDWKARGAGREFCQPFVQWLFTKPQIWRLWTYTHTENIPAIRMNERMKAVREGTFRKFAIFPNISQQPQDVYVYSIVRYRE